MDRLGDVRRKGLRLVLVRRASGSVDDVQEAKKWSTRNGPILVRTVSAACENNYECLLVNYAGGTCLEPELLAPSEDLLLVCLFERDRAEEPSSFK